MPVDEDGLWPMRCPEHPEDHFFKIEVTQNVEIADGEHADPDESEDSPLYCAYCGYAADLWDFAPEQHARMMAAATAAAEQYAASMLDEMLGKAFGGRSRSSSRKSGVSIEFKPGRPPSRRTLPELGEVEQTRRTMQCNGCDEKVAVYGLAIYCPNCGQLAPAQQLAELLRMHRDGLAALHALPEAAQRTLAESGALTVTYENTIKDGFGALETYLRARFEAEAPDVSLRGKGNVFQRLDDAADLYREHLGVDVPTLLGDDGWAHLKQIGAMRHVLVHNAGIVDDKFLERLPDWPQRSGQRLQIKRAQANECLDLLDGLAQAVQPR
jgi:hypothetical protein